MSHEEVLGVRIIYLWSFLHRKRSAPAHDGPEA